MRRHVPLLLVAVLMASSLLQIGCGRKATALNGTWKVDADKQLASIKSKDMFKKLDAAKQAKFISVMQEGFDTMSFTFADGKLSIKAPQMPLQELEYKVVSTDGDTWQVETIDKKKKAETMTLTWTGDDSITLSPPKKGDATDVDFFLARKK